MIWQVLVFSDNILPKEMKSIWKDLGSNSGPPAWQISTGTNRPWLLRWQSLYTDDINCSTDCLQSILAI